MFSPLVHRLQKICMRSTAVPVARQCLHVTPQRLAQQLPALGSVLYMPMRSTTEQALRLPPGFLVEALLLAPLMQTHWLMMASVITVDGPREWMECVDREGHVCARLHLLPDTDYLAWDAVLGCGEMVADFLPLRHALEPAPASAQMLRFHTCRLANLCVLGAELVATTSRLSRDLAGRIARDEALPLQLATSQ